MGGQSDGHQGMQGSEEQGFIPGLRDEIVLEHIVTKIPWRSMFALVRVSRNWRKAIRRREIYNVRKRLGKRQSMAVTSVSNGVLTGFYDMESQDVCVAPSPGFLRMSPADRARDLPSHWTVPQEGEDFFYWVPQHARRSDDSLSTISKTVFLDGKMYLLSQSSHNEEEVEVLDVAACQSEWELCSSTVTDGSTEIWVACNEKIYSFHTCNRQFHGKVFDPKHRKWTEIEDRPVNVCDRATIGPTMFFSGALHGYDGRVAVLKNEIYVGLAKGDYMMVFDSVMERWRVIPSTLNIGVEMAYIHFNFLQLRVINEKLYNFSRRFVHVYDVQSNSWTVLQYAYHKYYFEGADVAAVACYCDEVVAVVGLDDESSSLFDEMPHRTLCKSVGFGVGEILRWEELPGFCLESGPFRSLYYHLDNLEL